LKEKISWSGHCWFIFLLAVSASRSIYLASKTACISKLAASVSSHPGLPIVGGEAAGYPLVRVKRRNVARLLVDAFGNVNLGVQSRVSAVRLIGVLDSIS
jgi:hypothetical protein